MIEICGRRVKIQTGAKSQTVNICTEANANGQYDYIVRLRSRFVSPDALPRKSFRSIEDLVEHLVRDHSGEIERRPRIPQSNRAKHSSATLTSELNPRHPLVELFNAPAVNNFQSLAGVAATLSQNEITQRFELQRKAAPRRGLHRPYFVFHEGTTTSGVATNRREEHLAIALWATYRRSGFKFPDGSMIFPMDYQLPLKSHRDESNAGIGKVDLFCVDADGEPSVAELKVRPQVSGPVDTPLRALLEALAYCAILDADMRNLSRESHDKRNTVLHVVRPSRPNLLVMAPAEYWNACDLVESRHHWREALSALRQRIEATLEIRVRFVRIDNCRWGMAADGRPQLLEPPVFNWAIPTDS